jgi:HAD superfamily hydrolase (TIGR01509 family)
MRIEALIFDVDGTLADTEEAHRRAFNDAFEHHRLGWHWSVPQYARLLRTAGGKERLRAYVDALPVWPTERRLLLARIPKIHESKTAIYARLIEQGAAPLREGVEHLIEAAERAGVRLAIATTTTPANIEALLGAALGERAVRRFAVVGAGDDVARKKPAPDIYQFVLRELRLPAARCVAFEDSSLGLEAAKAAGLFTVATPTRWTKGEDLAAADWILPSLASCERPLEELQSRFNAWGKHEHQRKEDHHRIHDRGAAPIPRSDG